MLEIQKNYVLDSHQEKVAVQITLNEFEKIEEILENFGLAKLDERLSGEEAKNYYQSLKKTNVDG